ncbi:MAG: hypothetical protein NC417_07605 [Candidatus Gastranaerophilales bacterium]|nr:hypothetical protein [Candidatus Gastranaerophilales bacterium]
MAWNKDRSVYIIFLGMALLCSLIWTFTSVSYDVEYQIAMAYRLLQGDKMILEMWEPHQTSIFLPAALMWIYRTLFHTTTGIVLYLQICGALIRCGVTWLLYRVLRGEWDQKSAFMAAMCYFMILPKDYVMPEFGNLQLWFATLFFCFLWMYLKEKKRLFLILGALSLCLDVLAYPSCAILLLGGILILLWYAEQGVLDSLILTGICAALGAVFGGYFLLSVGWDRLKMCIVSMLALEPSHTVDGVSKLAAYGKDLLEVAAVLLIVGGAGLVISVPIHAGFFRKNCADRKQTGRYLWLLSCIGLLLTGFLLNILSLENRCAYTVIFLAEVAAGFFCRKILQERERRLYVCCSLIGVFSFFATLILTDHPLIVSGAYGLLAVVAALLPIERQVERIAHKSIRKAFYAGFVCFLALLAFRCVYLRTPLVGRGQIVSGFSDLSIVRSGPALGIISDEEGVCLQRDSYPEWQELIQPGDKVWIVGGVVDTLGYLYADVEVAAPSTMSTPTYSEAILDYWRLNPDKYPDVVVASGYRGNMVYELYSNEWLMSWLWEEFQPASVVEGEYWIYYFREAR